MIEEIASAFELAWERVRVAAERDRRRSGLVLGVLWPMISDATLG
jgi:hypothetical protein